MTKQYKGFTLIEVLAAFVVFSLIFTVVMQLLTVSIRSVVLTKNTSEAVLWAETKLTDVRSRKYLDEGSEFGEFDQGFRWELHLSEYVPPSMSPNYIDNETSALLEKPTFRLMQLELKVLWNNDRKQRDFVGLAYTMIRP